MNLKAIAEHLQTQGIGTIGTTLFETEMPASCNQGVLLLGPYSGASINPELPDYYETDFRFVVRSTNYEQGQVLARQASRALKIDLGLRLGAMHINTSRPLNLPRPYRRSVGGYWEFEVDVFIVYTEADA